MLSNEIAATLSQLAGALQQISDEEYRRPVNLLSLASIGQHVRHIIELFQCANEGHGSGVVNYENRKRDRRIETDRLFSIGLLKQIPGALQLHNKPLLMEAAYNDVDGPLTRIPTNYYRELAYNLEHTIHHMALIRIALEHSCAQQLEASFGVAPATIQYRKQCAQ
jgi:hypothetical protein